MEKYYTIGGIVAFLLIVIFILWRVKVVFDLFRQIINDTLKRFDTSEKRLKWSGTKLTMLIAWGTALFMAIYDCYKKGFNEFAFGVLVTVALTGKVTDAWSKKLTPVDTAKDDSQPTV